MSCKGRSSSGRTPADNLVAERVATRNCLVAPSAEAVGAYFRPVHSQTYEGLRANAKKLTVAVMRTIVVIASARRKHARSQSETARAN